jgi:hypothetical protein
VAEDRTEEGAKVRVGDKREPIGRGRDRNGEFFLGGGVAGEGVDAMHHGSRAVDIGK